MREAALCECRRVCGEGLDPSAPGKSQVISEIYLVVTVWSFRPGLESVQQTDLVWRRPANETCVEGPLLSCEVRQLWWQQLEQQLHRTRPPSLPAVCLGWCASVSVLHRTGRAFLFLSHVSLVHFLTTFFFLPCISRCVMFRLETFCFSECWIIQPWTEHFVSTSCCWNVLLDPPHVCQRVEQGCQWVGVTGWNHYLHNWTLVFRKVEKAGRTQAFFH